MLPQLPHRAKVGGQKLIFSGTNSQSMGKYTHPVFQFFYPGFNVIEYINAHKAKTRVPARCN
jgi:hypothetical protein